MTRPTCVFCGEPADIRELSSGQARCWSCFQAWQRQRPVDLDVFVGES